MERNQTDADDEPKPDFEELAAGALENADIRPDKHICGQPVEAPAEPREVVYDIKINLQDNMTPVDVNNDQLAANGGAVMVEDVDDEGESNSEDEAKPAAVAQVLPRLPTVSLTVATAMALRQGS